MLCGLYVVTPVEVVEYGRRRVETDVSRALTVTGSRITAKVLEFAAEVTLEQTFFNPYGDVTTSYVVPLDPKAAMCGFTSVVNGVETKAVVQDKRAALQTYKAAVTRGDSAQLLERQRDDVFQMRVGGVRAGDTVIIRITYVTQLDIVDGSIQFIMPTRVVPRYQPSTDNSDGPVGVGALPTSNGVQVEVTCITASPIKNIMSPTYAVTTATQDACTWVVSARLQELMKDFVLQIFAEDAPQANLFVEKAANGSHACMLTFVPKIAATSSGVTEFVLMIDCSGSMSGEPLAQAQEAKDIFVQSLPEGCLFNIVCFGSTFTKLWPQSVAYTTKTRQAALALKLKDMGGTELFVALKSVLTGPLSDKHSRQVVILTDGDVGNTTDIGQLVASHRSTTRCFCLGIGRGVSHDLVDRVARNGRGTADYVYDVESLPRAVARLLADAMQPCMADVTVNWNVALLPPAYTAQSEQAAQSVFGAFATTAVPAVQNYVRQSPKEVPVLLNGRRFVVYLLLDSTVAPPASVRVETEHTAFDVPVSRMFDEGTTLHTLAARALIRDLEDAVRQTSDGREEILRLGLAYNLASSQTSFVAVQQRVLRMCEESEFVDKCELFATFYDEHMEHTSVGHGQLQFCKSATKLSRRNFSLTRSLSRAASGIAERLYDTWSNMFASPEASATAVVPEDVPRVVPLQAASHDVVSLQEINGSWLPNAALAQAMSLTSAQLGADVVFATILAVEWIKKKFGDDETYALVLKKAKQWLTQKGIAASDGRWEQARQLLAI